jgi:DNA-binding CsgD family transcriptional regulator
VALSSLTVRAFGRHLGRTMNAPVRLDVARTLPTPPLPCTLPQRNETERCVQTSEVIDHLVDALLGVFMLTAYEEQVAHHMLFGRSCEAIAWRLGVRSTTVHKHMHRIYAKTGARDRAELYTVALRIAAQRIDAGRERLAA